MPQVQLPIFPAGVRQAVARWFRLGWRLWLSSSVPDLLALAGDPLAFKAKAEETFVEIMSTVSFLKAREAKIAVPEWAWKAIREEFRANIPTDEHIEQLLTRRTGRHHCLVGADDLHDTVDHSRPCHDLLRQREQRPELGAGSEEVGVVHHRNEKRLGDARRRVCRLRFRPNLDQRVEPGDPRPIDLDRVAVPGRHSRLGHGVVCEHERERVVQVLSYDLCRAEGMHEANGDPAPQRRVRAGPRVAYTDDPCGYRNAVHNETSVTVDGAAHGEHVGDRLTVEPVCVQRTCGDESRPVLGIAQLLQRLVARGDVHGYRPGARVAGEREERKRMEDGKPVELGRGAWESLTRRSMSICIAP